MGAPDLLRLLIKNWSKHGIVPTATLQTLTLGSADSETGWFSKTYANSTVSMFIIAKQLQFQVFKEGLFIEYDAVGFTKDAVYEGDLITDGAQNTYLALAVRDKNILSQFMYFQVDLKKTAQAALTGNWTKLPIAFTKFKRAIEKNAAATSSVTLYPLSVDSQEPQTGWYECNYQTHSTIDAVIMNARASTTFKPPGRHVFYQYWGYTLEDVNVGDLLVDSANLAYRIRTVMPVSIGQKLVFFELGLERLDAWTRNHLFQMVLDVRIFNMETLSMSYYIAGATVDIYLAGALIISGTTDALGTFVTSLAPGVYDIIIHKTGYQTVTKHEVLSIQTELMVNLPATAPQVIGPPIIFPPGGVPGPELDYSECVCAATGVPFTDAYSKVETFNWAETQTGTDDLTRSEGLVITNS